MSDRLKRHIHELYTLHSCKPCQRNNYLKNASPDLVHCLCEVCHNILKGNIPISKNQLNKLKKHRNLMRKLVDIQGEKKNKNLKEKRKLISQTGGFLPLILTPLLTIASELIANKLVSK